MQDIKIVFFDTETTGLKEEDRILQIAYSVVSLKDLLNGVLFYKEEFFRTSSRLHTCCELRVLE